jgi:hypothetical protein
MELSGRHDTMAFAKKMVSDPARSLGPSRQERRRRREHRRDHELLKYQHIIPSTSVSYLLSRYSCLKTCVENA